MENCLISCVVLGVLLIRCLAIDVLLLHALAPVGMCLPSRCLAVGLYVTIFIHLRLVITEILQVKDLHLALKTDKHTSIRS
jgi:hypothetical protein